MSYKDTTKAFSHFSCDITPIDNIHPALKKYNITFGDIRRISHDIGIAPPTLFGIVTGITRGDGSITRRLITFFDADDIEELNREYNPYRNMSFLSQEGVEKYDVRQHFLAGMLEPGNAIKTDDDRWVVISGVEKTQSSIRIFSGGFFLATLHKESRLTVALPSEGNVVDDPKEDIVRRGSFKSTREVFDGDIGDTSDFYNIYRDIASAISKKKK